MRICKRLYSWEKQLTLRILLVAKFKDDPQLIPGHTSSYIGGISFWGFELGGAETSRTPDKTIHKLCC